MNSPIAGRKPLLVWLFDVALVIFYELPRLAAWIVGVKLGLIQVDQPGTEWSE